MYTIIYSDQYKEEYDIYEFEEQQYFWCTQAEA